MQSNFLSASERKKGTKFFLLTALCNGLGVSLLATTIVQLLALNFGANNYHIGLINSLMHLSGVLLIFIPNIIQGRNLVKVFSLFWFLRGIFILLNLATLFVPDNMALMVVIVSYALFCISRIIGFSTFDPIRRMLSTTYTRGEIVLQTDLRFNSTVLFGYSTSFIIVSIPFFSGLLGLLSIQLVGVIMNSLAAFFITRIPCREKAEKIDGINIFNLLWIYLKDSKTRIPIIQDWITKTHLVLLPFIIALLKKTLMLPQNLVLLYSIIMASATLLAVYYIRPFIDKISSRPIIFIISFVQGILLLIWIFIQPGTSIIIIFLLGFFTGFTKGVIHPYIAKNLIHVMPDNNKVNFNAMQNFFSGVFSFVIGGMFAGFLGDLGEVSPGLNYINPYYLIFILSALLAFVNSLISLQLKGTISGSVSQTLKLFFSIKNLKAFMASYYLSMTFNRKKRSKYINILKFSDSSYAVAEIRNLLYNPLTPETQDILSSLYFIPRPQLLPDIINIADDHQSYRRDKAIFALGAYPIPEVEKKLIQYLSERDPIIQSTAAKSLARIGNKNNIDKVMELAKIKGYSTWVTMNFIIALNKMDDKCKYLENLFIICNGNSGKSCKQAIYSLVSRELKMSPPLNFIYQRENLSPSEGLNILLEETRQFHYFNDSFHWIISNYKNCEYSQLHKWCCKALKESNNENPKLYLKNAIINYPYTHVDKNDALAMLYFTFQVLSASVN
ncbi:MAG: MFS transporter [Chitinispirillia bacterium]|jgi:hypothetical protein